jgi:membrane protein implicated in regulation of membrane protease activity
MAGTPDETKRFIRRISRLTFFLVCISSALFAGALLFLITGLIAAALDLSPGILTLLVFVAFLAGAIIPIIMLKRARKVFHSGRDQPTAGAAPRKESRFNRDKETRLDILQRTKFSENVSHTRSGDSTNSKVTKRKQKNGSKTKRI